MQLFWQRKTPVNTLFTGIIAKAGDGNRTHVTSLEGWCSTIEPRLREASNILQGFYGFVKISGTGDGVSELSGSHY